MEPIQQAVSSLEFFFIIALSKEDGFRDSLMTT